MGVKISIDKHVSELDDILEMSPHYLSRVQFESKIGPEITQHLKIWRFYESKKSCDVVKSSPVSLHSMTEEQFYFSQDESYLLCLIYKNGCETINDLSNFPHSLWGVVQSAENLTPRGLNGTFSSNEPQLEEHSLDSFLLSRRRDEVGGDSNRDPGQINSAQRSKGSKGAAKNSTGTRSSDQSSGRGQKYKFMLFVWNGKNAGATVKAQTLTKGYALDSYLHQAKDSGLNVLFSGGVVKNKKLQRGNIYIFEDVIDQGKNQKGQKRQPGQTYKKIGDSPNQPSVDQIIKAQESLYLIKWLFPQTINKNYQQKLQQLKKGSFPSFQTHYLSTNSTAQVPAVGGSSHNASQNGSTPSYWDRFEIIDDTDDSDGDEFGDDSEDDDVEMKDLQARAANFNNQDEYNEDVINDQIEDIESDDENAQIGAYEEQRRQDQRRNNPMAVKIPGLSLGGLQGAAYGTQKAGEPNQMSKIPGLNIGGNAPGKIPESQGKVPGLNIRGNAAAGKVQIPSLGGAPALAGIQRDFNNDNNTSGRQSSKRHAGMGSLNIGKAVAIQQQNLNRNDANNQVQDIDNQESKGQTKPGIGGFNLGSIGKPKEGAQISMSIGLKTVQEQPPSIRMGGDQNQQQEEEMQINAPRGGRPDANGGADKFHEDLNEKFDFAGTSRNQYVNAMYNTQCSMILDDFLYLGGDLVAKDLEKLKENGITHVINCAADYSANYCEKDGIKYLPFHLKDHVRENIECCFYQVIDFMETAKKEGGRVYIHCVQGVSRSTTMCLCYMIFTQKVTLEDGLAQIRERRQIANPNMTFMAQLIWFYKRLYGTQFDTIPVNPRVFLVSSHQPEDPYKIACRLLMDNLYLGEKCKILDPRAIFIIQSCHKNSESKQPVYIWKGGNVPDGNLTQYMNEANRYVKLLQKNENAPEEVKVIEQGSETNEFWNLFFQNKQKPSTSGLYGNVNEWNHILLDLANLDFVKAEPAVNMIDAYNKQCDQDQLMKAKLYCYPNWNESSTVFDYDDLVEDTFLVLCVRAQHGVPGHEHDQHKAYVWKGNEFDEDEANNEVINCHEFVQKVLEQYWGCKDPEGQLNVQVQHELFGQETDEFTDYL